MRKFFLVIVFSAILKNAFTQELGTDANTLLLLHFNNNTTGADGEVPVSASNISFGAGKHGNALSVVSNTTLRFDTTQNLKSSEGTIEFWIKMTSAGAAIGMEVLGGLAIDVGNSVRLLQNVGGGFGNPELALVVNNLAMSGVWNHLAFTWGQGSMKIYFNGSLVGSRTYNFQLQPAPSQFFNIGSYLGGFNQMVGLLDELRISNRIRTQEEISISYLMGIGGITNLNVRNSNPIVLYKTWNLYLMKQGYYKVPSLYYLRAPGDTVNLANALATWTVNNSVAQINNGVLTAMQAGNATLTASLLGYQVSIPIQVINPVREPDKPATLDPFMTNPISCHATIVPVLVICYLPTQDGINMDLNETENIPMPAQTVTNYKEFINKIVRNTKFAQEESSRFRVYNNPASQAYVGYKIVDIIYAYEPVPRGFPVPWNQGVFFNDYNQILPRFNTGEYVDNLGVKEVWVMGYHKGDLEPPESNMSSPTTGDISNSSRFPDDMPIYSKTYIVYGHNVPRGPYGAGHIYGHQFEAMLSHVAAKQDGNVILFNGNFVGRSGPNLQNPPLGRCGDTHHPPNTTVDYDYDNSTLVASDLKDWKPAGGTQTMVNRDTWGNTYPLSVWPEPGYTTVPLERHVKWYMMWMQSFPGNGNQIPHGLRWMTNWWRFLADWDSNTVKIGLHQATQETLENTCLPYISTGLSATTVCSGGSFSLNYTAVNIAFNANNIFTIQLSNGSGSFLNPTVIGNFQGSALSGNINISLPPNMPADSMYRLRIISSNPVLTSDASNVLIINPGPSAPVITPSGQINLCNGGSVTLTSNTASGNQWYKNGIILNGSTGVTLNVTSTGTYTVVSMQNNCQSAASNAVTVNISIVSATVSGSTTVLQNANTSSPVTFTAGGGSANYTFTYTVSLNGGQSGNPQIVTTTGGGNSVVIQQSNAVVGSYTYTLLSVTDNAGCGGTITLPASVTINIVAVGGTPDLTSSQFFSSLQLMPGQVVDEVIALRNVGNGATSGPINISFTNYSPLTGLTITLNPAPTVTIGIDTYTLDNSNWTFSPATNTLSSNTIIPAGGVVYIGLRITRNAAPGQGANGQVTQTTTIQPGTGGNEAPAINNSISNSMLKIN